jgi:hypothetical protein
MSTEGWSTSPQWRSTRRARRISLPKGTKASTSGTRGRAQASGMVLCLSDAPSAEAVKRIHERAGHPTTRPPRSPYRRDPPGRRHDREVVIGSRACPRRTRPQRSTGWGQRSWRPAACKLVLVGSILAAALTGCHPVRPDNQGLIAALHHGRSAEVTVQGLVVVLLPDGNGPDGPHQCFRVDLGQGVVVEVDHNLTLAPRVPVTVGSTVIVHGQFEPDPGRPVIQLHPPPDRCPRGRLDRAERPPLPVSRPSGHTEAPLGCWR